MTKLTKMTKMTEILVLIHRKTLALRGAPEPEFQSSLPWGSLGCCCHWISELEPLRLRGLEMFGEHDVNKLNKVQEWTHQLEHWANSAPVFFIVIQYFIFYPDAFLDAFTNTFLSWRLGPALLAVSVPPSPRGTFHANQLSIEKFNKFNVCVSKSCRSDLCIEIKELSS